jgi:hypothetical protein
MSLLDNLKGTLRSMIGQKTDKVVEEAAAKVEAPVIVEEIQAVAEEANETQANEAVETVAVEVEQAMDKVAENVQTAVDEMTAENNQ